MSFPYGKIVTHFQWFVNGEILIYGYFTFHSFGSGFHGDHCSSFCFCGDLAVGSYNCYGCFAGCISYFFLACYRSENCCNTLLWPFFKVTPAGIPEIFVVFTVVG